MNPQGEQHAGKATHERKDADVIGLSLVAGLLFLLLAICILASLGVMHVLNRDRASRKKTPAATVAAKMAAFPQPRLLVEPGSERAKLQKAEQTKLDTYGWVDRASGTARIPIRRAMELIVARGLPEVGAGQTRLQLMQSRPQTNTQPNEHNTSPPPEATP